MANVTWVGKAQAVPDYWTAVVASATVGQVRSLTINGQAVAYTVVTGDTVATVAAALLAAYAVIVAGEWKECTVVGDSAVAAQINITGPSDGAPIGLTAAAGITLTHVTTSTGPHHASNVLNYSSGALPITTADYLIFERGEKFEGPKYDLTAITALTLLGIVRLPGFKGVWGLPPIARAGYYEYRTRYLEVDAPSMRVAQLVTDDPFQLNVKSVGAAAVTIIATGQGAGVAQDVLDIYGLPASSVLLSSGASVTVATFIGQTATLPSVKATASAIRLGVGCTLTALEFVGTTGRVSANFATVLMDQLSNVVMDRSAASTTASPTVGIYNQGGNLSWESSGTPGAVELGTDGSIDFSKAPGCACPIVRMNERSAFRDPANRVTAGYILKFINCSIRDVTIETGTARMATIDVLA